MTLANAQRVRLLAGAGVVLLLVWAAGASSTVAVLVAFTTVVTVGLFLVPKVALAAIGVFLLAQPVLVNLAGSSVTPLGLALHRLHQAFAVAGALRVGVLFWWDRLASRLRPWLWLGSAFVALGVLSGVMQHVPLTTVALGAFLAVKFPIFVLVALTIPWDDADCERMMRWALWLGPLMFVSGAIIWMLPADAQNLFVDRTLETESYGRGQFAAMQGIFSHPGVFGWAAAVTGCYAVAALLVDRPGWRALATGSVVASVCAILASLRRKPLIALPAAALYGVFRFATGRRRWGVLALFAVLTGAAAWVVAGRVEAEYRDALTYVDPMAPTAPRVLLYVTGVAIANSRFPLGAGFGRFGGYASALDYSPLYDQYGLSGVNGLSPEQPYYIEDTYWPHIAAETGWLGAAILVAFYLLLLERASRVALRAVHPATRAVAIGASLALLEGLIESAAGPVFESVLFAYGLAVPLGVVLARSAAALPAEPATPAPLAP